VTKKLTVSNDHPSVYLEAGIPKQANNLRIVNAFTDDDQRILAPFDRYPDKRWDQGAERFRNERGGMMGLGSPAGAGRVNEPTAGLAGRGGG
jgi:hypothetical protein